MVGPSGAGHYVKMVHNGIEYALLQAYAEGFMLIKREALKTAIRTWNKLVEFGAMARLYKIMDP